MSVCYTMRIKGIIDFSSCKDLDNNPVRKYILDIIDYYKLHKRVDDFWPSLDITLGYVKENKYLRLFAPQIEKELKEGLDSSWNENYNIIANIKNIYNKEKFLIDFMFGETKNKTNALELFLFSIAEYFNGEIYYSHDEGPDVAPDYEYVVCRHFNNLKELIESKLISFNNDLALKKLHNPEDYCNYKIEFQNVFNLYGLDDLTARYNGNLLDDGNEFDFFGQF